LCAEINEKIVEKQRDIADKRDFSEMPDPSIIVQAEQLVKRIKKSVEQRIKEISRKLGERRINETLVELVPRNKKEIQNDYRRKCESMSRAWTQKD